MPLKGKKLKLSKSKILPKEAKVYKFPAIRPDIMHTYLRHTDINQYMQYVSRRYPSFVTLHTIGMTYEHRPLMAIEIDCCRPKNPPGLAENPGNLSSMKLISISDNRRDFVFIEGGTHAREWLTISVALNCIHQLTEKNVRHRDILGKLRFFIVPVVNPDGYEYAHSKNRSWRKNRRPSENNKCVGTDCNRNYDVNWELGQAKPFRSTFRGEAPFSEEETKAMRYALQTLGPNLLFFLSLHSHAQSILYPWGYRRELPKLWPYLQKVALAGREAIRKQSGRIFACGSIANASNRLISGSVVDYAFGTIRVPLALVMELPSADFGFHPPPNLIHNLGNECWVGIREMCRSAIELAPVIMPQLNDNPELIPKQYLYSETKTSTKRV